MIEAKRGWANTISTKQDYNEILSDLGKRYEAALNTYKPFACGIVMHPAIDAAIQLRNENKLTAEQIERVDLKVHPLVIELTGKKTPREGLEGKFSIYHAVAVALVEERRRREAVQRPRGDRSDHRRAAVQGHPGGHTGHRRGASRHDRRAEGRPRAASAYRTRDRQRRGSDDRQAARDQVRRPRRRDHSGRDGAPRHADACWNVENLPNAAEIAKMSVST